MLGIFRHERVKRRSQEVGDKRATVLKKSRRSVLSFVGVDDELEKTGAT